MSIKFYPRDLAKRIAPRAKVERLIKHNVSLKRTALSFVDEVDFLNKNSVARVALKTLKSYKERIAKIRDERGKAAASEIKSEIVDDPRLLVQRIQGEVVWQINKEVQQKYKGKLGRWLPSGADEPRPLHQKAYGETFTIGEGLPVGEDGENVEPGDEPGCDCGVEILTDETKLELD